MFTNDKERCGPKLPKTTLEQDQIDVFVNPIQESPQRVSIYSISKCEDQVIGFEFVSIGKSPTFKCFGKTLVNFCDSIEIPTPISLKSIIFKATSDPCYIDWEIEKTTDPDIEVQYSNTKISGVMVRFFKNETCCFPSQMAFKLIGTDINCSTFSLASGLLVFK